jgi:hypothetical protein
MRKDRLLERLFIDAEGRAGGDNRGSFFDIFKQQVGGESSSLEKDGNGTRPAGEPIDSKGNPLLIGNDGTGERQRACREVCAPIRCSAFSSSSAVASARPTTIAEFDGNGQHQQPAGHDALPSSTASPLPRSPLVPGTEPQGE